MLRCSCRAAAVAIAAMGCAALPASADRAVWDWGYLEAEEAGELSTCIAGVDSAEGSFLLRLHGEEMDFIYYRSDFTLPWDRHLGATAFVIDGEAFALEAFSFARGPDDRLETTQHINLVPAPDRRGPLFDAIAEGRRFDIAFPDGSGYRVSLRGSARALDGASRCWRDKPTGPLRNNPFSGSDGRAAPGDGGGVNPFRGVRSEGPGTAL